MRRQIKKFKMASFDMLTPMPSRTEMPMLKAQIVRWDGVSQGYQIYCLLLKISTTEQNFYQIHSF